MVMDHRPRLGIEQANSRFERPGLEPARETPALFSATLSRVGRYTLLIALGLASAGCQSTVDAGRSMRPIPQRPAVIPPAGPEFPSTPIPQDTSGLERQPAAAVLQLPQVDSGESKYHTVKSGDTWSSIARQYQMTVRELTDANGIDPSTVLQPGQMIYIPEK